MDIKPAISRITIYPVKSLEGIELQKAQIANGGCLLHDREYAIKDINNKYVNGKKNALVHLLRMRINLEQRIIFFKHELESEWHEFSLENKQQEIDEYLSSFFGKPVKLYKNSEGRFLDVPDISGMTLLSTASLQAVSGWFNNIDIDETRARFRATLEISNVPAFWEDRLFCSEVEAVEFKIGDVTVLGMSPRARCIVPTRHPQTGDTTQGFQKSFAQNRKETIPLWSSLTVYNHAYYLSVDCLLPASESGKWINTGDEIKITGKTKRPLYQFY